MAASSYVTGERKPVMCPVDSATVITKGDLVYLDTDDVKPLASLSDSGTKAQNQTAAHLVFMGVALRSSPDGSALPIPVASAGVFEFDTASATYEIGDTVGPAGTGSGGNVGVSNDTVAAVASGAMGVGRVYKRGTTVTRVQVEIVSTVMARDGVGLASGTVTADVIAEASADVGVTIDGVVCLDGAVTCTGDVEGADLVASDEVRAQYAQFSNSVLTDLVTEYTSGAGITIDGGKIRDGVLINAQGAPTAETTTTPTLTAAEMYGGLITSTQTGAVTATVDTGTAMDTALAAPVGAVDRSFDWSLINLGSSSGAVTVTPAAGHTLVGLMVVAITTSGRFRTRRTATNTWITYRLA